jgi:hypothetical protein
MAAAMHADRAGAGDEHVLADQSKRSAVCVALPSGSMNAATSSG